jgi:enoyl-CoA hydratase/carnithine racemase
MTAGSVTFERAGDVAHITFDRPEARNALTREMYGQLSDGVDALAAATDVRVAVVRGAGGRAFSAGTDIREFTRFASAHDGVEYERLLDDVLDRLEKLRIPTIAVVEGVAMGGGLAIACACDLRVCTPDARFGMPMARTLGNCLSMRNHARLVAMIGAARTKAMLITAEPLTAEEAKRIGFVLDVVAADQLDARIDALCDTLRGNAPITMRVAKEAIRRIVERTAPEGDDLIREAYGSRDFSEGVAAFVEKRLPQWTGR